MKNLSIDGPQAITTTNQVTLGGTTKLLGNSDSLLESSREDVSLQTNDATNLSQPTLDKNQLVRPASQKITVAANSNNTTQLTELESNTVPSSERSTEVSLPPGLAVPPSKDSIDEPDRALNLRQEITDKSSTTVIVEKSDESATKFDGPNLSNDEPALKAEQTAFEKPEKKNPELPYEAGQFSPLNPNGRRKYSREFLRAVEKMMEPELGPQPPASDYAQNTRLDIMAPSYMNQHAYSNNQPPMRRSSQQVSLRPRKVIATSSLQPDIELKTSENAWKPELEPEKMAAEKGDMDTKRLLKIFRGLLNKLTPQKYDSIIEKVLALDLDSPERLSSVIDLVFDKAVDEPGFCELYAEMCTAIAKKHKDFLFYLVKRCQEEFETSDIYYGLNVDARNEEIEQETDQMKKKLMSEELYEDMRRRRKKYLGTIKLIGEMYKFKL